MPFIKGQSGNPAGRPRINPLPEAEAEIGAAAGTEVLPPPPPTPPMQTASTAVIDRSLLDAPKIHGNALKPTRSMTPMGGYIVFRCYLGHVTYAPRIVKHVACLVCNSKAMPVLETAICLCTHHQKRHAPHCLDCGKMQADRIDERDSGSIPVCPAFNLSA